MDKELQNAINQADGYESLVRVCQEWAEAEGIELCGTYVRMARMLPSRAAEFKAFRRRVVELDKAKGYR